MRPVLTHIALQVRDLEACLDFYRHYCGMDLVHDREEHGTRVAWIAEPGRGEELVFVLMSGGTGSLQKEGDYGHLGFALESREEVDRIAALARQEGRLVWPPRQEPHPVGYYCGIRDPDGKVVEFSYGQPLGPGAP